MSFITRWRLLASASAAGAIANARLSPAAPPQRPNVILILADDLGYGDLGCYGQQLIRTPHLDAMAAEGLLFRQAYSGSTVCAPSRCCLMTGRHTGHATVRGNQDPHVPLGPEETTVAQLFKQAGYRTGCFGKWGLGTPPDTHALPTRKGFDEFYGYLHQVHAHTYFPDMLWDNERESYLAPNFGGARKIYSHDRITERALRFIDRNHSGPFFLYAPFTLPHGRYEAPDAAPYEDMDWDPTHKMIASMIGRLDRSVGQILERLKRYNIEENTLVFFTSDNGPGGASAKRFGSSGPFRGFKRDLYEGGIRVPLLARWKGTIRPGTSDHVVASWDYFSTAADLTGQRVDAADGISFAPTLRGDPERQKRHSSLYWEFFERGFQQAVRMDDWKGVRLRRDAPLELFNLARDPGEKENLAAREPDIVKRLEEILRASRTPTERWG